MAGDTHRYADLSAEQKSAFYDMRLLTTATASFPHAMIAQMGRSVVVPDNEGVTINWR